MLKFKELNLAGKAVFNRKLFRDGVSDVGRGVEFEIYIDRVLVIRNTRCGYGGAKLRVLTVSDIAVYYVLSIKQLIKLGGNLRKAHMVEINQRAKIIHHILIQLSD